MRAVAGNSISWNSEVSELPVFVNAAYLAVRPQAVLDKVSLGWRLEHELSRSIAIVTSGPCTRTAGDYTYAKQQ